MIKPELLSHGTIECSDIAATRRFLTEFLGIDVVRPLPEAQYLWKGGPWSVVCVCVEDSEAKAQGPQNRFKLSVGSASEVDAAHTAALAQKVGLRHPHGRADKGARGHPLVHAARPQHALVGDHDGVATPLRRNLRKG